MPDIAWLKTKLENLFSNAQEKFNDADKNNFLKKIKNGNVDAALYFACKKTKKKDDVFYRVIELLLTHKETLEINVNYSPPSNARTLSGLATQKEGGWLYELLEQYGANTKFTWPDGRVATKNEVDLYVQLHCEVLPKIEKNFLKDTGNLNTLFTEILELPLKGSLDASDDVRQSDELRLQFINQALNYLEVYYKKSKLSPDPTFTPSQQKIYSNYILSCERNCLEKICHSIHHLSGPLRKKYDNFALAGFSWINFEQLGSYLLREKASPRFFLPFGLLAENLKAIPDYIERFQHELADTELIIEDSIPDIIQSDIEALSLFFKEINQAESSASKVDVKPPALPAIKAITARIASNISFLKLFNLFHFTEHKSLQEIHFPDPSFYVLLKSDTDNNNIVPPPSLMSMKSRHALLKRLLKIGELFVGRNFSSELFDLDPTVPWRYLVTIRDGICHQDERTNALIVQALLNDPKRLEKILHELEELGRKVFSLLEKREQIFGRYQSSSQHWKNISQPQPPKNAANVNAALTTTPTTPVRRISKEDEDKFIKILINNQVSEDIQKQFQAIFDGTRIGFPSKVELGKLGGQAYATLGKEDKISCRDILSKLKPPATTQEERNQKRDEEKKAKEEREKNKNSLLNGFDEIRKLAEEFNAAAIKRNVPNPMRNIAAAKQALESIKEYLNEYQYLVNNKKTFAELEAFHEQNKTPTLKVILSKDNELNDALEYNLGQLLQHLEQLFSNNNFATLDLNKQRAHLRKIRNYIEHGDPILDTKGENYQAASEEIKQELYITMIDLIYDDCLSQMEEQLTLKSPGGLSLLAAPVKATGNTTIPATHVKPEKMEMKM